MNPQNQAPTLAAKPTPYDFILNHSPQKPSRFGGSLRNRIIIVVGGVMVLLVAVLVLTSLLGGGGNAKSLVELSQQQQELIRVAGIGVNQVGAAQSTQNLAITTQLAVQTDQTKTLAQLKKTGHKVKQAELNLKKNTSTDQQLTTAAQNNGFDAAFIAALQTQLKSYRTSLQQAYKGTTRQSDRKLLQASFNNATYLIGDIKQ